MFGVCENYNTIFIKVNYMYNNKILDIKYSNWDDKRRLKIHLSGYKTELM